MQITTKFSTNETVYLMRDNKILRGEVSGINIGVMPMSALAQIGACETAITYDVRCTGYQGDLVCKEDQIHATPEECADRLLEDVQ